ncbi:leucine--tRNA ligase [Streptomyces caniscabiei]|uniref:leucine--tRNA ligase n=1 Tax=Streptomyces caniscabiei TaxID=2746961 RepID=UPI0029B79206|nr:leucine--tRNA ligase [Streptomyces caniscabiei]MDX2775799.1 leucine--tRNA ligase [Streptomyces caniscabiei]
MKRYNPSEIEQKWQETWEKEGTYEVDFADHSKPKYYGMSMLPGITGAGIHIGHGRTFQFSDIKVRAKRQQGFNAYNPIGWDSFGLPVENYAIKVGKKPREAHDEALVNFKRQLKRLGYSYDWSKEISTADPAYYKWTQWIFNRLYENGLAYQKESPQWWCETDKTVLANEQVEGGKCWRCGNPVVKKNLKQWFFKITEYADEMLEATDELDWTEMVRTMQKNWIGKSQGAEVDFAVDGSGNIITVFTTRPDTIFGATLLVVAPEHPMAKSLADNNTREAVEAYINEAARKSEIERMNESREKTGVFTGSYAVNPANGQKIPIWIADYVLATYGTGAIMAVPAHDERDFAFAEKFDLPIIDVVEKPEDDDEIGLYHGEGVLVNSGAFDGMRSEDAREEVVAWLEERGVGRTKVTYKMRDWLISRQRYWGAPIPIVHCDEHGAVPVPDDQLPVVLPDVEDYKPTDGATSALANVSEWVNTTCPTCGKPAKRETDTMDGYACSSWYFLRYLDPFNDEKAWDPEVEAHWGPVDFYNGGDHAVAHLLYSRFWMRFFYKQGWVSTPEPFKRMMYNAYIMAPDGLKMSKSKGNVIDPLEIMDSGYGADALRVYEMFIAPYDVDAPWDTRGVPGTYRFLSRVWNLTQEYVGAEGMTLTKEASEAILTTAHRTVKKITEDIEHDKFNTAVSSMMEAVNGYYKLKEQHGIGKSPAWKFAIESLLQVLAPFAPHITEELWHDLGYDTTIHVDTWPEWDDRYLQTSTMMVIVQVNGKLRAKLSLPSNADEEAVKVKALADPNVAKFLEGREPRKVIYVAGKLVNIVL